MVRKFSWVFLPIFQLLTIESLNNSGKSYYFKTIGNNEFTVYNRIHFLNHNISDLDANPHPPQNIQNARKETKELPKKVRVKLLECLLSSFPSKICQSHIFNHASWSLLLCDDFSYKPGKSLLSDLEINRTVKM